MNTPRKTLLRAAIIAAFLALGGMELAASNVVNAQPPATPATGHGSMSMTHHGAGTATPSCSATPAGRPSNMIATPGSDRQAQVATTGAMVMPFDLNRTTHTFTDLADGGREVVTANDPLDTDQISLIRMHLQMEVDKFGAGDFSDPAAIHGDDMPGLAQLRAGFAGIEFTYEDLPNGAAITYRSDDTALISALHAWFAAQRSDHGSC